MAFVRKASERTPRAMIDTWRTESWPPQHMLSPSASLPLFLATRTAGLAFKKKLDGVLAGMESYLKEECGGRLPRWMRLPKIVEDVVMVNIVNAEGKASFKAPDMESLLAKCGGFDAEEIIKLKAWFSRHPEGALVAHRAARDLRAYAYLKDVGEPVRVRFHRSGLVVLPPLGMEPGQIVVQDHRESKRRERSDAYRAPIAANKAGWSVYAPGNAGSQEDGADA